MRTRWKAAVATVIGAVGVAVMVLGSWDTAGQAGPSAQARAVPRAGGGKPDFPGSGRS